MIRGSDYYINFVLANATESATVLTGIDALIVNGLSTTSFTVPTIFIEIKEIHQLKVAGRITYFYLPNIDTKNYLHPTPIVNRIYMPIAERAIVELIRDDLWSIDEGEFLDGLGTYISWKEKYNYKLLLEVANHFGVSKDKIDYWIKEAEDYMKNPY